MSNDTAPGTPPNPQPEGNPLADLVREILEAQVQIDATVTEEGVYLSVFVPVENVQILVPEEVEEADGPVEEDAT